MGRKMSALQEQGAHHPTMSYHRGFEHVFHPDYPERDEARFYKIDVIEMPFWLMKDHTFSQGNGFQEPTYRREILQGKARQNRIF
ncbi:hypothetical protein GCM10007857_43950 [Bradyrhizobium iriomotense]|uniref:Uncharacterized protein n=1 Tax=Bradyrhizobium iriomotense TaxID=441950 RepID=A0ABQ6AZR9_9BRAD|nr:hypothetical protein GCM10007857_43950 [Bradyrhizobium iriomotense]